MQRSFIISEVQRTAIANGGVALGRVRLDAETGVKEHHWKKYWARYSDLVREAGFDPNEKTEAWGEEALSEFLARLARELGRFPTDADTLVKSTYDAEFPAARVFSRRLGRKAERVAKVAAFCRSRPDFADVLVLCGAATPAAEEDPPATASDAADGFVYLLKSGKFYKIGRTIHAGARERQLALQLPEAASTVHIIRTDDPAGIEAYWHQRFAAQRKNGEWFELRREHVSAFRRRKFM